MEYKLQLGFTVAYGKAKLKLVLHALILAMKIILQFIGIIFLIGCLSLPSSAQSPEFSCPMHSEITGKQSEKCSKCGMELQAKTDSISDEFVVNIEASDKQIIPGQKTNFKFVILHPRTGQLVKQFNVMHEKLFHLFVISHDFSNFEHLHPMLQSDGSFIVEAILPSAGLYHFYCDISPVGGVAQVSHQILVTSEFKADAALLKAKLKSEDQYSKTVSGINFTLDFAPSSPVAGERSALRYKLTDAVTGELISDLQPFLGAWGHTIIVSEDASNYLHSHPVEAAKTLMPGQSPTTIFFETFFPKPGKYRIWSQFKRREQIVTVSFDVTVSPPSF